MAFFGTDEAPVFSDPRLDFIQAYELELHLSGGEVLHIFAAQGDDHWSLLLAEVSGVDCMEGRPPSDILHFRIRDMPEFPNGLIQVEAQQTDEEVVQIVRMDVGGRKVILCAGEVDEALNGDLVIRDKDESVLIFLSEEAYAGTQFNQPIA